MFLLLAQFVVTIIRIDICLAYCILISRIFAHSFVFVSTFCSSCTSTYSDSVKMIISYRTYNWLNCSCRSRSI